MAVLKRIPFDPLVEFHGLWNHRLAERYLPIPELPYARYECWDGHLTLSSRGSADWSFARAQLAQCLGSGAKASGLFLYGEINLLLGTPDRWIQPDLAVLRSPERGVWVSGEHCVLAIQVTSQHSGSTRLDRSLACATAEIPWFMAVEIECAQEHASVGLFELVGGHYRRVAHTTAGQRFQISEPFEAGFDPAELIVG